MEKLITNPIKFLNMEKTLIRYKRFKLGLMTNALLIGSAYDGEDIFMAFGPFIIEINVKKRKKDNIF
jgi:hypothetical protein